MSPRVSGLVLAAGGSKRLGQPKQLLPFGDATLLDHVLGVARECAFDQLICVLGGASGSVRETVNLQGAEVVVNEVFGSGCSSSIAASLPVVTGDVLVLLLGDQPGVTPASVRALLAGRGDAPLAVCRYDDGRGHPFAFSRAVFPELAALHGDKGVWKLLERRADEVVEVRVPGDVPRDIDTWDDYEAVIASQ
jgi:molybdenum cofactor cytidylyltransferase